MTLSDFIHPEAICTDLVSKNKVEVLTELGSIMATPYADLDKALITNILMSSERSATTGLGGGIAIPHGKLEGLNRIRIAIGISKIGIPFEAIDGRPVHIFIAMLSPLGASDSHLEALAGISRLLKNPDVRAGLLEARGAQDIFGLIREQDGKS